MDVYEETRPSFHLNSFTLTAFKNSITDHPEDPKKHFRKHLKFQSPQKDLITSRGNFLTPRTQLSLSTTNEKENILLNLNKTKDGFRSLDSGTDTLYFDNDLSKEVPVLKWCAFCKKEVTTETIYKNSAKTFWTAVSVFLMGGVCGCFMLPYMTEVCKDRCVRCLRCQRELE